MATKPADDINAAADKAAVEYFWKNCERLISQLNVSPSKHRINRTVRIYENGQAPCVYAVVINMIKGPGEKTETKIVTCDSDMDHDYWKLVKVGRTASDTTTGKGNRMEVVMQKIAKWCVGERKKEENLDQDVVEKMARPLFFLRIDSKTDGETEEEVRKAMGLVIDKDLGKELGLPIHTEWVLTTQRYLTTIRKLIVENEKKKEESTCTLVFENTFAALCSEKIKAVQILLPGTAKTVSVRIDLRTRMAVKAPGMAGAVKVPENNEGENGGTEEPVVVPKKRQSGKTDEL